MLHFSLALIILITIIINYCLCSSTNLRTFTHQETPPTSRTVDTCYTSECMDPSLHVRQCAVLLLYGLTYFFFLIFKCFALFFPLRKCFTQMLENGLVSWNKLYMYMHMYMYSIEALCNALGIMTIEKHQFQSLHIHIHI